MHRRAIAFCALIQNGLAQRLPVPPFGSPFLAKLWPGRVDDIVINTSGLMISLEFAAGSVTPQSMRALSIAIKDYEAFANNEERTGHSAGHPRAQARQR